MKLTIDEKDLLQELLEHPGLPTLIKELESLADAFGADVLKYDLSTGNESELIRRKCRLDGAHKLVAAFKHRLYTLKPKA